MRGPSPLRLCGARRAIARLVLLTAWLLPATVAPAPARAADPVLAASGDIACPSTFPSDSANCQQGATESLIASHSPDAVAELGDLQYTQGTLAEFQGTGAYGATWGALNSISHPVPGNHEYASSATADGYYQYFGSIAGDRRGYYSYDLGSWHVVALNSNCADGASGTTCANHENNDGTVTSAEVAWLQSDLAAHQGQCTLAYWHHPLFTQGYSGNSTGVKALWDALYAHGADVVLNGHDHVYERYAQLSPNGTTDGVRGIREFVAGEGGYGQAGFPSTPTSPIEASDSTHFGVLFLALHGSSYQWEFDSAGNPSTVLDRGPVTGSVGCHEPDVSPGVSSTSPSTADSVTFNAHAAMHDGSSIAGYSWNFGDGSTSSAASPSHTYAKAGTYTITVTASSSNGASTTKTLALSVADRPPVASSSASASAGAVKTAESVSFDGSGSTDPDGTVNAYSWDFGDGSSATEKTSSHSYARAGRYTVTLTVTDDSGNRNSTTQTVTIADRPPGASFTSFPSSVAAGEAASFDASASTDPDGQITGYRWDFGDGTGGAGRTVAHRYSVAGTYTVQLAVTDNDGKSAVSSRSISVGAPTFSLRALSHRLPSNAVLRLQLMSSLGGQMTLRLTTQAARGRRVSHKARLATAIVNLPGEDIEMIAAVKLDQRLLRSLPRGRYVQLAISGTWKGAAVPAVRWSLRLWR